MTYIKIKGRPELVKDDTNGAILRINKESIRRHAHHIQGVQQEQQRDMKIAKLEQDIEEIKSMMKILLGSNKYV